MSSNLACIGLGSDTDAYHALLIRAHEHSAVVDARDDVYLTQWQDADGARLTFTVKDDLVVAVTPSLACEAGAILAELAHQRDEVWAAAVVDADGEQITALAADIEHAALLDPTQTVGGPTSLVALGVAMEAYADAAAFGSSPASILGDPDSEAPEEYVEQGWTWPPRVSSESFISYGVFDPEQGAHALLCGEVLAARTGHNSLTGQPYRVARVRTVGFEAEVCLDGVEHPQPEVGSILAGTVYLVACLNPQ